MPPPSLKRAISFLFLLGLTAPAPAEPLPGTKPWDEPGDPARRMVDGIHAWLDRETAAATKARPDLWKPDASSNAAFQKSIEPKRERLKQLLGMVDFRSPPKLRARAEPFGKKDLAGELEAGGPVERVQWNVFRQATAEGLCCAGAGTVIVIPDVSMTPEQLFGFEPGLPPERQWANRLAALGKGVIVPALIDRRTGAQMPGGRISKLSQREVLWRASYEMGRTLTAYDLHQILSLVDFLKEKDPAGAVSIIGAGEGARLALLAAALDPRIASIGLDGGLAPLESQWSEPIDRTVFGLHREFGVTQLATLIAPRPCVMLQKNWPEATLTDQGGGSPGTLAPPAPDALAAQAAQLKATAEKLGQLVRKVHEAADADSFLESALQDAGIKREASVPFAAPKKAAANYKMDHAARQARLFNSILTDTQQLLAEAPEARAEYWNLADFSTAEKFTAFSAAYRQRFRKEVICELPPRTLPLNPRARQIYENEKFRGYEIMLDLQPDLIATGTLLVPRDLQPGQKRAVVVCQHGLEGRPSDLCDPALDHPAYHRYGATLAGQGYIVYAPQNPYLFKTHFRQICRKAWPLGLNLWSFILQEHEATLDWLAALDFVDPKRIAFYGLSYGGKTAMRMPALLDRYCLSICSADYNEWIWKNVSASAPQSYLHSPEYDMVEWNLGNTFNYAEMSWLIFPRPFMVERGHNDTVSVDEWVAHEFARTFRHYSKLGFPDRAQIEFFNGPHTINGKGTFEFLRKHLGAP